jgi:hypothetical protein
VTGEAINQILAEAPQKEKDKNILLSSERPTTSQVHGSYEHMNLITENELLFCRYITSDTTAFPFSHVSLRVWFDVEVWWCGEWEGF